MPNSEIQQEDVQQSLREVIALLEAERYAELREFLNDIHPADVAYMLDALPLAQRLEVWDLVKAERDGEILLEVSDSVRESLIASMDTAELRAAAGQLDTDEIADIADDLPEHVVRDLLESLDAQNRARLQSALSYDEESVGALMDFDMVTIREDISLEVVLRYLRRFDELPDHTDALFVVDRDDHFKGILPLHRLLLNDPETEVATLMEREVVSFEPADPAQTAAQAFERYDLVSAPVVDSENKLVGRVTVNNVMDYIREESGTDILNLAGLNEEEDLFASAWKSGRNRWLWLSLNLFTAFIASRVIGAFEGAIVKLVALAALMPIVASLAGNTGNQTVALIVRAIALGQINAGNVWRLFSKEIKVGLLNGTLWGTIGGLFAYLLYGSVDLALVMASAIVLNLLVAALAGVFIPIALKRFGRDPAMGSSVLLTALTDSMGFFIFLGLASIFLI